MQKLIKNRLKKPKCENWKHTILKRKHRYRLGNKFLDLIPKAQVTQGKYKMDIIKLKSNGSKDTIK